MDKLKQQHEPKNTTAQPAKPNPQPQPAPMSRAEDRDLLEDSVWAARWYE